MLTTRKEGAPPARARAPLAPATGGLLRRMVQYQYFYLLLLPAVLFYFVFNYIPIYGIVLAFKHYRYNTVSVLGSLPILGYIGQFMNMEWVGLQWFELLWGRPDFWRAFTNTLIISFLRLLFGFPAPIVLALLINEVRRNGAKRVYQTVYTFPHFLSWVLVAGVLFGVLGTNGVLNQLIVQLGGERTTFLIEPRLFRGLLVGTEIWKSAGWGSIIYLAAIAGIDPQLYEAATIDGAGRWKSLLHITWPGIKDDRRDPVDPAGRQHPERRLRPDLQLVQTRRCCRSATSSTPTCSGCRSRSPRTSVSPRPWGCSSR